jgi:hypothetical protein
MTKAKISEYDAVAANNTDVNGVNIDEGCAPSGMNNMGREIMAALKRFETGADGDSLTVGGNLVVSGTVTAANTATLGNVDVNGGTIDGAVIGGSTAAAGSFTTLNTSGAVVFNDAGADVDFRVEGDTEANLLFVDASTDRIGIGTASPAVAFDVVGQVRASTGILFGSDTAAANALDDYEEGIFTPTAFGETTAGTTTYVVQQGTYEKIGRFVHVEVSLQVSNMTGTGKLLLGGLPFTMAAAPDAVAGTVGKVASLTFSGQLGLMGLGGQTFSRVIGISTGSVYTQQDVDTAFEFTYSISYHV